MGVRSGIDRHKHQRKRWGARDCKPDQLHFWRGILIRLIKRAPSFKTERINGVGSSTGRGRLDALALSLQGVHGQNRDDGGVVWLEQMDVARIPVEQHGGHLTIASAAASAEVAPLRRWPNSENAMLCFSARFRSEMSRATPTSPTVSPVGLLMADVLNEMGNSVPSRRRFTISPCQPPAGLAVNLLASGAETFRLKQLRSFAEDLLCAIAVGFAEGLVDEREAVSSSVTETSSRVLCARHRPAGALVPRCAAAR